MSLLRFLCAQVAAAYGRHLGELPMSLETLSLAWVKLMGECASAARPLRVAIDSLDQLTNYGGACSRVWGWLPRTLPPHVSLVVSTLPDDSHGILAQLQRGLEEDPDGPGSSLGGKEAEVFLEVGRLDPRESGPFLAARLAAHEAPWPPAGRGDGGGRRVTAAQMACLEAAAAGRGGEGGEGGGAAPQGATVLQLKLLAAEAAQWRVRLWAIGAGWVGEGFFLVELAARPCMIPPHGLTPPPPSCASPPPQSWDAPPADLPSTVEGLIQRLYTRLEGEHGAALVRLVLGLLAVRRGGLSAGTLVDAISASDDVLGREGVSGAVFQHGEPPMRRCPPLVFARLRAALGGFVVERAGAGGVSLLGFYHRQYWEAAERRYVGEPAARARLLGLLADLFLGKLAAHFPDRGLLPHMGRVEVRGLPRTRVVRYWRSVEACFELPAILLALGEPECGPSAARPEALARLFCDLDFVAAAAHDGRVGELLANMQAAEEQLGARGLGPGGAEPLTRALSDAILLFSDLVSMRRWVRLAAPVLADGRSYMAYVDALSSPPGCAAERAVRAMMATGLDLTGCFMKVSLALPPSFSLEYVMTIVSVALL